MKFLAFDTSTDLLSLAVSQGEQVWAQTLPGGAHTSASLIPGAMDMLAQAGLTLASLDAVVFGRGPGSFTGLRTACSVAQGLAFGVDILVLPVDTLMAVADEAWHASGSPEALTVVAMLDARMDEVYSATFRREAGAWSVMTPLQVGPPAHVQLPAGAADNAALGKVLLAGNVFDTYGDRLPQGAPRCTALPTAQALLRLAPVLWAAGQAVPPDQAMPVYVRNKVAYTTAEREAIKAQAALDPLSA